MNEPEQGGRGKSRGLAAGLLVAVLAVGYMAVMFVWAIIRLATPGNWS